MIDFSAPDLTRHPPRSLRVRLEGFVILARVIDKCRAILAGTNGEYDYACALDQHFFRFTQVDPDAMKAVIATGAGDAEIAAWVYASAPVPLTAESVAAWSRMQAERGPTSVAYRTKFNGLHQALAPHRDDIVTSFDMLDLDDFKSFGGKP